MLVTDRPKFRFFVWPFAIGSCPHPAAPAYVLRAEQLWVYGSSTTNFDKYNSPPASWWYHSVEQLLADGFVEVPKHQAQHTNTGQPLYVLRDEVLELIT